MTSYEVEYSRGGSSPRSHIRTSGTSINITGLQPVTNYTVQVYAENSVGRSNPATASVQTIMATSMCVAAARHDILLVTFVLVHFIHILNSMQCAGTSLWHVFHVHNACLSVAVPPVQAQGLPIATIAGCAVAAAVLFCLVLLAVAGYCIWKRRKR